MVVNIKVLRGKISKSSELSGEEIAFLDEALMKLYTEYSVGVSSIVTALKLGGDPERLNEFHEVIVNVRKVLEEGSKNPWDGQLVKKLDEIFSFIKPNVRGRFIHQITNGNLMFYNFLEDALSAVDLEEVDKLTNLL